MENNELKYVIEALLFASERPLTADQIKQAFEEDLSAEDVSSSLEALKTEYESQQRGFRLFEIAGGYQLVTDPRFAPYLKKFYQEREKKRLSQASLETLSVIAYRQPVTRADIEFIRGVNVDGALKTLLEKGLVKIVGRKEVPGRPMLYGTTKEFLDHFGLKSVKELPALSEYSLKDIEPHLLPPELRQAQEEAQNTSEPVLESGSASGENNTTAQENTEVQS
jgi:segregation and condensation protein B